MPAQSSASMPGSRVVSPALSTRRSSPRRRPGPVRPSFQGQPPPPAPHPTKDRPLQPNLRTLLTLAAFLCLPAIAARAELRVVVTVKPIHSIVAGVMAGIAEPYLIVKGAASPHTYAMKPSDAAALQGAGVVFRVSTSFERFLEPAIRSGSAKAEVVALIEATGVGARPYRTGKAWQTGAHDGHDHHQHGAAGTEGAALDPHIWLDTDNAIAIVAAAAQTLGLADPRRLPQYAQNAAAMAARLKDLQSEIQATLTPVKTRPYLVYHDAYQYFETAFGVPASGAIALGDTRAPGAKTVRALRARVTKLKIRCIFTEPQFEPKIARALAEGTPARLAILDPIGADIEPGPGAYFTLMRRNAKSLAECLK